MSNLVGGAAGVILAALLVVAPCNSAAQDKRLVKEQAKEASSKLRAQGEPLDRCFLGATLADGPLVMRSAESSVLRPGDKIVALNGVSAVGKTADAVVAMLREVAPSAVVTATVDRQGQRIELPVRCANARQINEPILAALDAAARGRFEQCVEAIDGMAYIDTGTLAIKAQCNSVVRGSQAHAIATLMSRVMEMAIEDAYYVPSARPEIAKQLRNGEAMITSALGPARFQALVDSTARWPGDEQLFAKSAPDWALFRKNAENALRARLIDPDSARIQWTHGFLLGTWKPFLSKPIEGYWSCGLINARNRMGGYAGTTSFVVVLAPDGYVKYSEVGSSDDYDLLSGSCGKSVKLLPAAPPALTASTSSSDAGASVADELQKLVDLRNSGAITDAEFQAAKQRLLGTSQQ